MTLLHQDGFDGIANTYDLGLEYTSINSLNILPTGGRYGGIAINAGNYNANFVKPIDPQTDIWWGQAIAVNNGGSICGAYSINGLEFYVGYISTTAVLSIQKPNGTVLDYCSCDLNVNVYNWLEVHAMCSGSGIIEVWVNDVQKLVYNGNAAATSNATNILAVAFMENIGSTAQINVDDVYILNTSGSTNNGRLGDLRIGRKLATADAGTNQGTPSSGSSHFAMVDEVTSDYGATYITLANTVGETELFDFAPLTTAPSAIFAVKVINVTQKSDGSPCAGNSIVKSSGTTAVGPNVAVLTSFANVEGIFENDPHTSAAWTESGVNAIQAGFIIAAP